MSVYRYTTANFEFSWGNDRSVTIREKDSLLVQKGVLVSSESNLELYTLKGSAIGAKINDFDKCDGSFITILIKFFAPVQKSFLRNEIMEGLKYYKMALAYKVLVASDVAAIKIEAISKDYNNAIEAMPKFLKELQDMEDKAVECHISEPMVASTGLMVYETIDRTWFINETSEKFEDKPEYIKTVDAKDKHDKDYFVAIQMGTEQECIAFVLDEQKAIYDFSISDLLQKRNDREILIKTIKDMELLLKISEDHRWEDLNNNPAIHPNNHLDAKHLDTYVANLTQQ